VFPLRFQRCERDSPAVNRTGASHLDPEWINKGNPLPHGFAPRPLDGFTLGGKKPQIAHRATNPSRGHRRLVARAGDETSPPTWLGHSPLVAATHDLRTRDAHFEEAIRGMPRVGEAEAQAAPIRATA
jgi:hypothetical protein